MALSVASSTEDVMQVLRHALVTDSTIAAVVGDNVWTSHVMDADAASVTIPCIVMSVEGGSSSYNGVLQFVTIDIYAYSKISQGQAASIYDKIYKVLQANRLALDNVDAKGVITENERPSAMYNDSLKAWAMRGIWVALTAG